MKIYPEKEEVVQVSVIIVTQNVVKHINKCLSSLMNYQEQGYIKEILVVDGQSNDGTTEIVKRYPIKLILDEQRVPYNPSFPRNIGWQEAKSELIMFIDSDAYLGEGFFPELLEKFRDKNIGIVGCRQIPVIENKIMLTIGQWWDYHMIKSREVDNESRGVFKTLFKRALGDSSKHQNVVGPCYVIRRKCLEDLGGFNEEEDCADTPLSISISEHGYGARWWFGASLYHRPKESIMSLIRQRVLYGRGDGYHIIRISHSWFGKLLPVFIRLGTPVIGVMLAIRYKNPRHIYLFPLAHYSWIAGYFQSFLNYKFRKIKRDS